jgi:DNA-directed RNA polymerase specialized sigma24 family protein
VDQDLIDRLEREWPALAHGPLAQRLRLWADREPALRRFANPQELLRALRQLRGQHDAENLILAALLREARTDPLAARIVLQALLPGLKNLVGRLLFEASEREELWSLLLASLWARIRHYPLERRPQHLAANLLQDTIQATVRQLDRTRRARRCLPPEPLADTPAPPQERDVLLLLADAVKSGVLSPTEAALIFKSRIAGYSVAELAAQEELPYITLYMRRHRAERRLLLHLGERPVKNRLEKAPLSTARAVGDGLTGSAGRGAVTHLNPRR